MIRRLFSFAMILSGLLALPLLCQAGMLAHACADAEATECGHEDECASDPCAMGELSTGRTPAPDTETASIQHFALAPSCEFDGTPVFAARIDALQPLAVRLTPPPLLAGASPLLI